MEVILLLAALVVAGFWIWALTYDPLEDTSWVNDMDRWQEEHDG